MILNPLRSGMFAAAHRLSRVPVPVSEMAMTATADVPARQLEAQLADEKAKRVRAEKMAAQARSTNERLKVALTLARNDARLAREGEANAEMPRAR